MTMRFGLLILLLFAELAHGRADAADHLRVQSHEGLVTCDAILAAARAYFAEGSDSAGVVVEPVQVPGSISLRGKESRLLVSGVEPSSVTGTLRLALVEDLGGTQRHVAWVTLAVRRYATVLVAAERLDLHSAPGANDVREERRETTVLGRGVVSDRSWLEGKRTRRMVAEGNILFDTMFEPEPVVLHGQQLTLRIRSGGVTLSMPVVAREDGVLGETISVQKVGSSDRLAATVAGERAVEIIVR